MAEEVLSEGLGRVGHTAAAATHPAGTAPSSVATLEFLKGGGGADPARRRPPGGYEAGPDARAACGGARATSAQTCAAPADRRKPFAPSSPIISRLRISHHLFPEIASSTLSELHKPSSAAPPRFWPLCNPFHTPTIPPPTSPPCQPPPSPLSHPLQTPLPSLSPPRLPRPQTARALMPDGGAGGQHSRPRRPPSATQPRHAEEAWAGG